MTSDQSAGASRRSRRLALTSLIFVIAGLAFFGCIERSNAQQSAKSDVENATQVLRVVKGLNPIVCAALDRGFGNGYGRGQGILPVLDSISPEDAETARWIGRNKLDPKVLDVVRPALADADACTRRIAARIAADTKVARLDQELNAELSSSSASTRRAAVVALGFADQKSAAEKLRTMLRDESKDVRLAALWALGSIEDDASQSVMVELLKSDRDPQVREIAAWALGRILDK